MLFYVPKIANMRPMVLVNILVEEFRVGMHGVGTDGCATHSYMTGICGVPMSYIAGSRRNIIFFHCLI